MVSTEQDCVGTVESCDCITIIVIYNILQLNMGIVRPRVPAYNNNIVARDLVGP